ncbi:MAG: ABC transporter substrate-binding protein [Bradyrhizobium sp.]|nr:ABC transporter substrate-binding protein [Bradyrhizobium sp.]
MARRGLKFAHFWVATAALGIAAGSGSAASADTKEPIKIGIIAEIQSIAGAATPGGAQIAADEINAKGGVDGRKIEIVSYDNKSSSADSVRAFQRAVSDDKVSAVIASYISEVVLALEPWAARLHMPLITPGAASNEITRPIHTDYDKNKYTFHGYLTSAVQALAVCDAAKDLLVDGMKMKTAVIMSEDAAWTKPLDVGYEECLPKAGLKVLDHIRFSPDTTDFTPIFNQIEAKKPDVIVTGISHVGVQPTVQWKNQQVPIPIFGISAQALSPTFWGDTNGAAEGIPSLAVATSSTAVTPKTKPFAAAFKARFGTDPAYTGYTAYDDVYILADAIKRAGSTDPDKMVAELEKTDYVGTIGRLQFYGRDDQFTHGLKYGPDNVSGMVFQWQDGKQVTVWPARIAEGKLKYPAFARPTN